MSTTVSTSTTTSPTSTSTSEFSSSWSGGNGPSQPSSILFFIAVAIGVLIALIFVFFSVRYYVRSRLGIFATARVTTLDNGVIIVSNDFPSVTHDSYPPDAFDAIRAHRRRRRRYLKKRRLTEEEVNHLFPVRTYQNWLDGGAEMDAQNRAIVAQLKEENDEDIQNDEALQQAVDPSENNEENNTNSTIHEATSSSSSDQNHKEIDLSNPFQAEMHFDSGTCAICIDTFESEDPVRGLICGHVFHQECLDPWLTKRKACCPMCKRDYYMKNSVSGENEDATNGDDGADNNSVMIPDVTYTTVTERVTEILNNHPEYQAQAEEKIKKYMARRYRFFWRIMGISAHDFLNSAIMELDYENTQRERELQQQSTSGAGEDANLATEAATVTNETANIERNTGDSQEARERIANAMV